jgi:predicted N-acetyltransferase YhbS
MHINRSLIEQGSYTMIIIREERPEDREAIRRINEEAFGQPAEAEIVDKLREACKNLLSLVAVQGEEVVATFSSARHRSMERGRPLRSSAWA